jgi:hypothetical protein
MPVAAMPTSGKGGDLASEMDQRLAIGLTAKGFLLREGQDMSLLAGKESKS